MDAPTQPKVFVWDLRSAALVTTLAPDPSPQTAERNNGPNFAGVAFSPKGLLAVSGNAATITLFETTSFRPVGKLGGVADVVGRTLEFSRDGTRLVSGDADNQGLREFKSGWGACEEPLAYSVIAERPPVPSTDRIGPAMATVIRRAPTWVCRAMGEVLYRYAA